MYIFACTLLKVVSAYDESVLSISVVGGVSSIHVFKYFC